MRKRRPTASYLGRQFVVLTVLAVVLGVLAWRAVYLQVVAIDYLQAQGNARYQRVTETAATRGMILDRHGEPLAVSSPVDSVWAHPPTLFAEGHSWPKLARLLGTSPQRLKALLKKNADREFVYLRRHLPPDAAQRIMSLNIPGVDLTREYRRYYPTGPVFGQIVGFTNIDDQGQEGLELMYDQHLAGTPGKTRVLRDRVGHVVEFTERINPSVKGQDLMISLDARIQYLAFRHLRSAFRAHRAKAGSVVVLDATTGEVLAMVNEPGFNPNDRRERVGKHYRNRAVTDVFEPGSTIKPFTVAAALQQGTCVPDTRVDTTPGWLKIGAHTVRDAKNYGLLTVSRVIVKSSNVGAAKIALGLPAVTLPGVLGGLGFGEVTGIPYPGEVSGSLPKRLHWRRIEHASLAYGYGLSTTALQLARAYTALANAGRVIPVSLAPINKAPSGHRVFEAKVVKQVRNMLELAVGKHGTGKGAQVARYRVAGKTGTVHKLINGHYADDRYLSVFAGFAPVTDPKLVMVVILDDPRGQAYFGGEVAAPVFAKVMSGALRLLNIAPDLAVSTNQQDQRGAGI